MKKTIVILITGAMVLFIGVSIAYYNTKSLLYENASIISFSSESVNVYDYNIKYKDLEKAIKTIKNSLPKENITI